MDLMNCLRMGSEALVLKAYVIRPLTWGASFLTATCDDQSHIAIWSSLDVSNIKLRGSQSPPPSAEYFWQTNHNPLSHSFRHLLSQVPRIRECSLDLLLSSWYYIAISRPSFAIWIWVSAKLSFMSFCATELRNGIGVLQPIRYPMGTLLKSTDTQWNLPLATPFQRPPANLLVISWYWYDRGSPQIKNRAMQGTISYRTKYSMN